MEIVKTNSSNPKFIELVKFLDQELAIRDGDEHEFYHQFNQIDTLRHVILALTEDGLAIACGAFKLFDENSVEIKRMYTQEGHRGQGIARKVLSALESWAMEEGFERTVLETGKKQPEAIELYKKCGYQQRANFGQYEGVENSLCFEKKLI